MNIDVYDTYATHTDGTTMHFDVLLPRGSDGSHAEKYAAQWLNSIGIEQNIVQLTSCRFCHSEPANPETTQLLEQQGYAILQMEGCPAPDLPSN